MAKFCTNCGEQLKPGAKFCPKCGKKVQLVTARANDQGGITIDAPEGSTVTIEDDPFTAAAREASEAKAAEKRMKEVPAAKAPEKRPSAGKKKGSGLCFVLAVIMVIEFFYAGFRQPGFLRKSRPDPIFGTGVTGVDDQGGSMGVPDGGSTTGQVPGNSGNGSLDGAEDGETITISLNGKDYTFPADQGPAPEVTYDNCPGNPKFISVRYSGEEIGSAPKYTAPVSEESPSVQFDNGIGADLFWWNLESGPDELVVRMLPEKTNEDTDDRMIGYDFSLSSGRHEFSTNITVTIPRTASDANEGGVMYFNEETGEWERVYYEVSGDGGSYVVYMDHFSTIAELLFGEGREKMGSALAGNIFVESSWRPKAPDPHSYMTEQEQAEHQWDANYFVPPAQRRLELVNMNRMCQFIVSQEGQSQAIVEAMVRQEDRPGAFSRSIDQVNSWFGFVGGSVSTADTAGKVSGAAAEAAGILPEGKKAVDVFFESIAKTEGGTFSKAAEYFDKGSMILLAAKVLVQCFDKKLTWGRIYDIYDDNKWDGMGVFIGLAGEYLKKKAYFSAAGAMPIIAVGLFVVVTAYDALEKGVWAHAVNEHETYEEMIYHEYLMQGNPHIVSGYTLYPSAKGFADALNYIYENEYKDSRDFNSFANRVESMIDRFVDEFWTLSDEEIEKFANKNAWVAQKWERPLPTYVKEYKYRIRMGLYDELAPILENLAKKEYIALVEDYTDYMETYIIPVLNTEIYMIPKDLDLPAGEDPLHSVYLGWNGEGYLFQGGKKYIPAAEFTDAAGSLYFLPRGAEESRAAEYTKIEPVFEDGHSYKTIGGNNYLYKCTFYHYVQIGSPTHMKIEGISILDLDGTMGLVNWKNAEYRDDGACYVPVEYESVPKGAASYKGFTCDIGFVPDDVFKDLLWGASCEAKLQVNSSGLISGRGEAWTESHKEGDPIDKPGEKKIETSDMSAAVSFEIAGEVIPGTYAGTCTINGTGEYHAKGRYYWQLGAMNMGDDTTETDYTYSFSGTGAFGSAAGTDVITLTFDDLTVTRGGQSVKNGESASGKAEWSGTFWLRFAKEY